MDTRPGLSDQCLDIGVVLKHLVYECVLEPRPHVLQLLHRVRVAGLNGILYQLHFLLLDLLIDELVQLRHILLAHQFHALGFVPRLDFFAVVEKYVILLLFIQLFALPPEMILHHLLDKFTLLCDLLLRGAVGAASNHRQDGLSVIGLHV